MNVKKNLDEFFDIAEEAIVITESETSQDIVIKEPNEIEMADVQYKKDIADDYKRTRENLQKLTEQGLVALADIGEIAKESQTPRAYEVFSNLMRNLSESTEKFMELHHKMQNMRNADFAYSAYAQNRNTDNPVTNNTINIKATTSDVKNLLDSLKKSQK